MQSVYDMPVVQDGPPPGGFPPLRYARRLPSTGPTGFTLFAVAGAIMAYGFVKVGQTNHHRRYGQTSSWLSRLNVLKMSCWIAGAL